LFGLLTVFCGTKATEQSFRRKNGYETLLSDLKLAVDANNEIIGHILKDVDNVFENLSHENRGNGIII
jgi:hypothetical protein